MNFGANVIEQKERVGLICAKDFIVKCERKRDFWKELASNLFGMTRRIKDIDEFWPQIKRFEGIQ